ncbi:ABC transporter substrate-binding protein [Nesterenkonia sp. CF4.4]|uniref:ABC transporter substrate-binding protein n=1 Tax=Nesterenkonia sp. CF4.4 TaxID=3373079 RepID=UPI003EE74843
MHNPRISKFAVIGTSMVAILALSACSGGGGGEEQQAEDQTVTVWHYFSDDNQVELMDQYKEKFESENEGVTVENTFVPYDQMNSNLLSATGSGEGPDVAVFNGADASTLALGGALAPMDEYWESFEDADQFSDAVLHVVDDETYAAQGYVNLLGLWYNADILAELGIEPPTTMDELEDALQQTVDAGNGGITLSGLPNSQGEWQAYPILSEAGFSYESPEEDALAEGLGRVRQWVEDGWLSQEAVNWDQTVPFQEFAAGNYTFALNGNWQQGTAESEADFEYGVVPFPVGEQGGVYLGGEGQGIGANSDNPDLAWEYLQSTYYDQEAQLLAPELVGSLPSRADAAQDDVVATNELLEPFSESIETSGTRYPVEAVPAESVADLQVTMGQAWSAVIGDQTSPEDAAADAIADLEGLLEQ